MDIQRKKARFVRQVDGPNGPVLEFTLPPSYNRTINRLPSDVFQQIFGLFAVSKDLLERVHNATAARQKPWSRAYDWLVLMQVCRRWCSECVACTSLWSTILIPGIHRLSFVYACLQRAKNRPLSVSFCDWKEPACSPRACDTTHSAADDGSLSAAAIMLEIVLTEGSCIRDLYLAFQTPHIPASLLGSLSRASPTLRMLKISACDRPNGSGAAPEVQQVPQVLLDTFVDVPSLRDLRICAGFRPSFSYIERIHNLVHLDISTRIRDRPFRRGESEKLEAVLHFLGHLPSLRDLHWSSAPRVDCNGHERLPVLTMNSLRSFEVTTHSPEFAAALLHHLRSPHQFYLGVHYVTRKAPADGFTPSAVVAPLVNHFRGRTDLPIALASELQPDRWELQGIGKPPRLFTLTIEDVRESDMAPVVRSLPSWKLTALVLISNVITSGSTEPLALEMWTQTLPHIVECTVITNGADRHIPAPKELEILGKSSPGSATFPWLKLRSLQLHGVLLRGEDEEKWFTNILALRRSAGCAISQGVVCQEREEGRESWFDRARNKNSMQDTHMLDTARQLQQASAVRMRRNKLDE